MWEMTLEQLVAGTKGKALSQVNKRFTGVGTDTRADLKNQIFVALKGDNFDAHDFLSKAIAAGAAAIIAHRFPNSSELEELKKKSTVIEVDDTLKALQRLGNFWRQQMKAKILGVTGTNGKTTTKEFAAAILSTKWNVQYSKGSFNNHWGVPISLLSIAPEHEIAVIEMGMNHPGEIRELVKIAAPDVVAVTMVGRGHLEGVGSIEGVAKAKEEIYIDSAKSAAKIFNIDNPHTKLMYEKARSGTYGDGRLFSFSSEDRSAQIQLRVVAAGIDDLQLEGSIDGVKGHVTVPVFGAHNVNNLMLAAAFALACGMNAKEIWNALPKCRSGWGRNQWVNLKSGGRVLFDAYNANPESMRAALRNFASLTRANGGKKIAVLAEMREMGDAAPEVHRELGEMAANSDFDEVYFYGPSHAEFTAGMKEKGFSKKSAISDTYEHLLASYGQPVISPSDIVLMKGSRGMQLERLLQEWQPLDFKQK
jgi:UDP-N-acetylmuramoyl-tripeptide--D-alanyl-D-alanine ligase